MSNAVLPAFPGMKWPVLRTPVWSSKIQTAASGKELRAAFWTFPRWQYSLSFEVLRRAEYQSLCGFFLARRGTFDSFLFCDPDDCLAANQVFGTGDGITKTFQLVRDFGGFIEPVAALSGTPSIFLNGVSTTAFTADTDKGVVTFNTAPAAGKVLSWSGGYYWRCRFTHDSAEFQQFMKDLWELGKLEFITEKP